MAISRERKEALVAQYTDLFKNSAGLFMTSYSGMNVKSLEGLRGQVRELGGEYHIIKNNLAIRAVQDAEVPIPVTIFDGPTAIGFAPEDALGVAKAIVDVSKENEFMVVKAAIIDGVFYESAEVQRLADLPPLPVVQAQLMGLIQTPATQVANVLAGSLRQVVNVMQAYSRSGAA